MEYIERRVNYSTTYLTVALMSAAFIIILLYPPVNNFLMRSSGSYVIYMVVVAIIIGLVVYISERINADWGNGLQQMQ